MQVGREGRCPFKTSAITLQEKGKGKLTQHKSPPRKLLGWAEEGER
jgi:hypothetical protein